MNSTGTAGGLRPSRRAAALILGGLLTVGAGVGLVACTSDGSGDGKPEASAAQGTAPQLKIVDPYIPQPAKDGMAAGYLVVQNDGGTADRLVSVRTDLTASAEIHQTVDNSMQKIDGIAIPAHGKGVLARGGTHIMFMDTTRRLTKGDIVDVTLTFEKSAPITVRVPVLGAADRPGDPGVGTTGGAAAGDAGAAGSAGNAGSPAPSGGSEHAGHGG
ncbi:copper chaperone PCu(A)C [Yinghuangia soli]|uniref:Copper chaperone PCu(A)C n=1 Tax=Yinghuangia soli TaxID=2908204 RepID=A0AA41PWH8_9ACTN|nr:copper chaperone PCu(A)C [Yinghuangia soli]MCF2526461.1 copper chaperone PCu(A)C [Yinghuangia soli]